MKFGLSVPVQHPPGEPGSERLRELLEQWNGLRVCRVLRKP
jgi:hypothetical protein